MPRTRRHIEAQMIYHVLNRGNGRRVLFSKEADFLAFLKLLRQGLERFPVDLLAFCLMPNHWHLLLRPRTDDALSRLMAWVTVTHARRHHMHYPNPGSGHLYQGRFKSFPVQSDEHFLTVARYIHSNPLRAGLTQRAEGWRWSDAVPANAAGLPMAAWPVQRPDNWMGLIHQTFDSGQVALLAKSLRRGTPFGSAAWVTRTAGRLDLKSTLRPRGRPKQPLAALSPKYRRVRQKMEADKST
ncbi:MAG: transposase [Phycisphaerales bacterium]|nr:transposase [Phycisphaerales bacterium]